MREWTGSVFPTEDRDTFTAKYREYGVQGWRTRKGFPTRGDAEDFLTQKRREYRMRRRGEFDPTEAHRHRPIAELIEEFREHLASGRAGTKHVEQSIRRLTLLLVKQMHVRTLVDADLPAAERALSLMLKQGTSPKTRDDYCSTLGQFGRWLEAARRAPRNPFALLRRVQRSDEKRERHRQALPWAVVRSLAAAAIERVRQESPRHLDIARRRALTVITAGLTGMRHRELAHLAWSWIDYDARCIHVPAKTEAGDWLTKNRCARDVPLHQGLGLLLTQEQRRRAAAAGGPQSTRSSLVLGEYVDGEPKLPRHLAERIREDAAWFDLPACDKQGRVLDLHALRGSLGTSLRTLGASLDDIGDVLGHLRGSVTAIHYVPPPLERMLRTIDLVPAEAAEVAGLWEPTGAPNSTRQGAAGRDDARRTGTE